MTDARESSQSSKPVSVRVGSLFPVLGRQIAVYPELRDAAFAQDESFRSVLEAGDWHPATSRFKWAIKWVGRGHYLLTTTRQEKRVPTAGFTSPDGDGRIRISLMATDGLSGQADAAMTRATGYLYLVAAGRRDYALEQSLLWFALELAAVANHRPFSETAAINVDRQVEGATRHTDIWSRTVPGGLPSLGRRR